MNYENLCRTCLRVTKTDAVELTEDAYEFLTQCLGINSLPKEYPEIQLPQTICSKCENRIIEFQDFLTKCREAETFFKSKLELLSTHDLKDELEASDEYEETMYIEPVDWMPKDDATSTFDCNDEFLENTDDEDASNSIFEIVSSENESTVDDPIVVTPKQDTKTKNTMSRKNCSVCGKLFRCQAHLIDHENMHKGIRPHCCDICGKCFTQKNTLITHQALHFGKQVECEECGKKFARKSELIQHDRLHRGEKPFECEIEGCTAKFRRRVYLREHQARHTGLREFGCELCGRSFFGDLSLRRHRDKVHPKFSYQCEICLSWFKMPSLIRKHMVLKHEIQIEDVAHLKKSRNADYNIKTLPALDEADSQ